MLGEDVEDHGRAVDHPGLQAVLEGALLAGGEPPSAATRSGLIALDRGRQLLQPAPAQVRARRRPVAALHEGLDHLGARGAQQLVELGQAVALLGAARRARRSRRPAPRRAARGLGVPQA